MFNCENLCIKVTEIISKELGYDEDKKAVINYGIFAIIQVTLSIVSIVFLGLIFGVAMEALIILFSISILRQASGGAHASTPSSCLIIGTVYSLAGALICKNLNISAELMIIVGVVIFFLAYFILWRLAPVDSIAKPINNNLKRHALKKKSIYILSFYLILELINFSIFYFVDGNGLLVYNQCINFGILWQTFSLTKIGHEVLGKMDSFFT